MSFLVFKNSRTLESCLDIQDNFSPKKLIKNDVLMKKNHEDEKTFLNNYFHAQKVKKEKLQHKKVSPILLHTLTIPPTILRISNFTKLPKKIQDHCDIYPPPFLSLLLLVYPRPTYAKTLKFGDD